MGRPVRCGDPQSTTAFDTDGRTQGAPAPAVAPRDDVYDLRTIVESVFDPAVDCVIYESPDGLELHGGDYGCLYVPRGAGLAAAATCGEALRRMGRMQFVVVVAALPYSGPATELERLTRLSRRSLIVAPVEAGEFPAQAELAGAGWDVADLRGRTAAHTIAKELVTARYDQKSKLVLVDAAKGRGTVHDVQAGVKQRRPARDDSENVIESLVAELRRRMAVDPRIAPVILVDDPWWRSLQEPRARPSTEQDDLEQGMLTAAALLHAGCHPVLVVHREQLARREHVLADVSSFGRQGCTVIVLGKGNDDDVRLSWPANVEMRDLARGAGEAAVELTNCLAAAKTTVLTVPLGPVAAINPRTSSRRALTLITDSDDETPGGQTGTIDRRFVEPIRIEEVERAGRYIQEYRFNPFQQLWIDRYSAVGKRSVYLWRWTACAVNWLTLSCVAAECRAHVCDTKFLAAMFNVLLDDIVDERRDSLATVDILSLMGAEPRPAAARLGRYGEFISDVWEEIRSRVREYPREAEYRRLLWYDFRQLCNQVDYSGLLHRHPHLINQTEHDLYSPHGMMVACAATLDLTCSPGFRNEDLGVLREAVWHANSMARIGNLVTTWEREISHDDFSSGVFARAVSQGCLQVGDLSSANRAAIEAAITRSGIEEEFATNWQSHRQTLLSLAPRVASASISELVAGLDLLLASEYASRGRK